MISTGPPALPAEFHQSATTTTPGVAVTATGDDTTALPFGTYFLRELTPASFPDVPGTRRLGAVVCEGGTPVPTAQGGAVVTIDREHRAVDCTVTDEFTREPPPPAPPEPPAPAPPVPTPIPPPSLTVLGTTASASPTPVADLVLRKRVIPRAVLVGDRVAYVVTIRNRGPAAARAVTVVDRASPG